MFHSTDLLQTALLYPAIDNHAHPLLKCAYRDSFPFEGVVSEAEGDALMQNAPKTVACLRATGQLVQLLGLPKDATWEDVKANRATISYLDLCNRCFEPTGIHCILLDDGLGSKDKVEELAWHDQFMPYNSRRIVRIEAEAECLLRELFQPYFDAKQLAQSDGHELFQHFTHRLADHLTELSKSVMVVGFKSIICYRTGLQVSLEDSHEALEQALHNTFSAYCNTHEVRLEDKPLNDHVLRVALDICRRTGKPIQFHTGLGDNDLTLVLASPALLQPLINAYPTVKFVLLHASYPFTREAGYLTSVYQNVYLDFGAVFPFVSGRGQKDVLCQVLELSPTNKVLFSTDGHYWPESYYLGTIQARNALYEVLREVVHHGELTEIQAIEIVKAALFRNANRLYGLGLEEPD